MSPGPVLSQSPPILGSPLPLLNALSLFMLLTTCAQSGPLSWNTRTWIEQRTESETHSYVYQCIYYQAFPSPSLDLFSKMLPWEAPLPASLTPCPQVPVLTASPLANVAQVTPVWCIFCLASVVGEAHNVYSISQRPVSIPVTSFPRLQAPQCPKQC